MGMGLLRWLLWPRRRREDDDDEPEKGSRSRRKDAHGVYRIEVDQEVGRFHRDGPAFSFWSSSRIILILSFLLWWIQPAGPMIAGYVGGRRAGSPWKAVVAALLPVFTILLANYAYAHNFAARHPRGRPGTASRPSCRSWRRTRTSSSPTSRGSWTPSGRRSGWGRTGTSWSSSSRTSAGSPRDRPPAGWRTGAGAGRRAA